VNLRGKIISGDALGALASVLCKAEVSENSIGVAVTILEKIGEFGPNGNLPKDPADWLERKKNRWLTARSRH
jgi:hypothetical protein